MNRTTPTTLALSRLGEVHPHHVERIVNEAAAYAPGTPVTFSSPRGEFYSGIKSGSTVIVTREPEDVSGTRYASMSVQHVEVGPHLSITEGDVAMLTLDRWTYTEVKAGKAAAEVAAKGMLERAYAAANGLTGAPTSDEYALLCLKDAHRLRLYAFALGVYADYIRQAECEVVTFIPATV